MAKRQRPLLSIERVRMLMADGRQGSITKDGRCRVYIDGQHLLRSRIVWALAYGAWPEGQVDHINCIRSDDRIENLRLADNSQNNANQPRQRNNTSGLKGVCWDASRGLWLATIRVNYIKRSLGRFATKEEAHAAYVKAAQSAWGEFARAA